GEPQGTAGRPMLAVLRGSGLGDVVVVVTRYFGGTLLGTGGLVKAYTEAAQSVVRDVRRAQRRQVHIAMLAIPYNLLERTRLLTRQHHGEILSEDFAADITLTLRFPVEHLGGFQRALQELTAGKTQAEVIETTEMLIPL
ncbi:MAG: YigZ family protein, partial [Anaerolineales bacterium]